MPDAHNLLALNINYWVLQSIAMLVTAILIPKLRITSIFGATATVVALAFVNSKVWDAALFFSVPNHFTSQALCLFLANGVIFWIVVKLLPGIEVDGILPALIAPVIFTLSSLLISRYAGDVDWIKLFNYCMEQIKHLRAFFESGAPAVPPPTSKAG